MPTKESLRQSLERIFDEQLRMTVVWEGLPDTWGSVYYAELDKSYWWAFHHTTPYIATASGAKRFETLEMALDALCDECELQKGYLR